MDKYKFEIGSPVFIMGKTDGIIYPGIVFNQIIEKTLSEEKVIWKIMVGPRDKRKVFSTDNLEDFEIYKTIFELKESLFNKIIKSIEVTVKDATANLKTWYEDEIPLPILAKALQNSKTKEKESNFTDAKNLSFKELAGNDAVKLIQEQAIKEVKKRGPKLKKQPDEKIEMQPVEPTPVSAESSQTGETVIRIKVKDKHGNIRSVTPEEFENLNEDEMTVF